jgi:hypothetical protein
MGRSLTQEFKMVRQSRKFGMATGCLPEYYDGAMARSAEAHAGEQAVATGDAIGTALRKLRPIEEKIVRLSYGIGCQRAHSAAEIAEEFGVGWELVDAILEEAEKRLAQAGVWRSQLQQAGLQVSLSRHRCRSGD